MRRRHAKVVLFCIAPFVVAGCADIFGIGTLNTLLPDAADVEGGGGGMNDSSNDDAPGTSSSDGAKDAGVKPGSDCPADGTHSAGGIGSAQSKPCGVCGMQVSTCLAVDGGRAAWSEYGACSGEVAGGCTPGEVVGAPAPCGHCGTMVTRCDNACAPQQGPCTGQPANSCMPGADDKTTAGCGVNGTYHHRTCSDQCTWGNYSPTCT